MRTTILAKHRNKRVRIFLIGLSVHFNLKQSSTFASRFCCLLACFLSFSTYYAPTPPSKGQTKSSNSTGIFRQQNLYHQERIRSEDTTVLCCCFRNFSQFINTKHRSFSACSSSKFRYFPYLAQKVKNQNCLTVKYCINS